MRRAHQQLVGWLDKLQQGRHLVPYCVDVFVDVAIRVCLGIADRLLEVGLVLVVSEIVGVCACTVDNVTYGASRGHGGFATAPTVDSQETRERPRVAGKARTLVAARC